MSVTEHSHGHGHGGDGESGHSHDDSHKKSKKSKSQLANCQTDVECNEAQQEQARLVKQQDPVDAVSNGPMAVANGQPQNAEIVDGEPAPMEQKIGKKLLSHYTALFRISGCLIRYRKLPSRVFIVLMHGQRGVYFNGGLQF